MDAGEPWDELDAEPADGETPFDGDAPTPSDAGSALEDAAQQDAAQQDAAQQDAAQQDAAQQDAAQQDAAQQDAAPQDAALPDASDGAIVDASPQDAAGTDANASDAASSADASDGAADAGGAEGLIHRYDFEGTGTTVSDSVGAADGRVLGGAQLDGSGLLTLDGSNDYVDLPNGLLTDLDSVTIVAWLVWTRAGCWQRVFDFGSSSAGEGNPGNATSSVALTTASCAENSLTGLMEYQGVLRAAVGTPLALNQLVQVALTVDDATSTMTVYANGARVGRLSTSIRLAQINDVNNWLGRSQWIQDPYLRGRLEELRIYARALDATEIDELYERGPDAL